MVMSASRARGWPQYCVIMKDDLADFIPGEAGVEADLHVRAQRVRSVLRNVVRNHHDRAVPERELRTG